VKIRATASKVQAGILQVQEQEKRKGPSVKQKTKKKGHKHSTICMEKPLKGRERESNKVSN
jgi:hypothetical protein